jgi:hypothetical protein
VFHHSPAHTSHPRTHQNRDASSTTLAMPPTQNAQQLQKDGRLALSRQAFQTKQLSSLRKAVKLYSISESSLWYRIKGALPKAQANA